MVLPPLPGRISVMTLSGGCARSSLATGYLHAAPPGQSTPKLRLLRLQAGERSPPRERARVAGDRLHVQRLFGKAFLLTFAIGSPSETQSARERRRCILPLFLPIRRAENRRFM